MLKDRIVKELVSVYKNGREHDIETFDQYSNLIFIDAGARSGELFPDENGPGVYFEIRDNSLRVREDLGKHVEDAYLPFPFEVDQVDYGHSEIHLFEPNPDFIDQLRKKAEFISKHKCIVWIHQIAVSDSNKDVVFKRTPGGWGSTICEDKENEEFVDEIKVKQIDFLNFIRNIKNRSDKEQSVHIKMDIEGAEYDTLRHLFDGWHLHCQNIKSLSVEFHRDFFEKKHDEWMAQNWHAFIVLLKAGIKFNWWPGAW